MSIPTEYLREKIHLAGWGEVPAPPLPSSPLGQSAATTPDQVADKIDARVKLLRDAAALIASDDDWAAFFDTVLQDALSRA